MTTETTEAKPTTPKEVFLDAIKRRINGNKDHGWGVDDSLFVIEALYESEVGTPMDRELAYYIKKVINPSACRQEFERNKVLNPKATKLSGLYETLV